MGRIGSDSMMKSFTIFLTAGYLNTFVQPFTSIATSTHPRGQLRESSKDSALCSSSSSSFADGIQVLDNVFSADACQELHELAVDHADRCDSSILVLSEDSPTTPLEHVLVNLLRENLHDTADIIEYWSRDCYMNIDAHCDIDERELENEGTLRFPDYSHVLYLQVSTKGPTCVVDAQGGYQDDSSASTKTVVTVPAVEGRLLRFPGNLLHAVPKPPHRWLLSATEERSLLQQEEEELLDQDWDDDEWDDDEDDEEEVVERSVLLFNTWSKPAPADVLRDGATGAVPDGIEIDGADSQAYQAQVLASQIEEWEDDYGVDAQQLYCNPQAMWVNHAITDISATAPSEQGDGTAEDRIRIRLMGKRNRRVHPDKHASLVGNGNALRAALDQDTEVSQVNMSNTE